MTKKKCTHHNFKKLLKKMASIHLVQDCHKPSVCKKKQLSADCNKTRYAYTSMFVVYTDIPLLDAYKFKTVDSSR